jgi:Kdo2-lipid IVA lauroyltransferase/acyltransferase
MKINLSSFLQRRFNIFMCRMLGWRITLFYMSILGKLYFFFNRKEKRKIKNAVKTVFTGRDYESEIKSITKAVFRGILFHYYEKLFNAYSTTEAWKAFFRKHIENKGITYINEALIKGRGVLLITGHLGGVEFIPGYLALNNYPVTIVVKFSTNRLRKISNQRADEVSARFIDPDKTPNIMKAIFDNLKENRVVITQCDEIDEWRPCRNHKIDFLGKHIYMDKTINILSKRCKAAIIFGAMHRDSWHRYKFITTSWEEMSKQYQRSLDMSIGEVVLKFMEHYIYKFPQEWYQWKKYPKLDMFAPTDVLTETPVSIPVLEPSLV